MIDCNLGKYEKLALLDALNIDFQRFFALNYPKKSNTLVKLMKVWSCFLQIRE